MSDQNEMNSSENQTDENQEQEIGILQVEPDCSVCSNCIRIATTNGCSVAEGNNTTASGFASHAEGSLTTASNGSSHSEGEQTRAEGSQSHAEGLFSIASGDISHAEGSETTASGFISHAEGELTIANGRASHAEGLNTRAFGASSHAEGSGTRAGDQFDPNRGTNAHAEGEGTQAIGQASHTEGGFTRASGQSSHAEGEETRAIGTASHAEGGPIRNNLGTILANTTAFGNYSHAEGLGTQARGPYSHTEGRATFTDLLAPASHAEGEGTEASNRAAHAEGNGTTASGIAAHAEGDSTTASGFSSHAEGFQSVASGSTSHAEGFQSVASGTTSHAEGNFTIASGFVAHAEGSRTTANASFSHAEGNTTSTNSRMGVHIMGRFGNANELSYSWYLANGTSTANRGLAAKILSDGNVKIDGTVSTPAADYAELFETVDGNSIDVGYFVTFDVESDKIRKAHKKDDYILGITSANPSVLGNSGELRWKNKYVTDEWGRVQYEDVVISAEMNEKGTVLIPEHTESQPVLNPEWNPAEAYIPRLKRPEWVAVGLLGQMLVCDDGTCKPGKYCRPNDKGIATDSNEGYRVMKRTGPNQILLLFK